MLRKLRALTTLLVLIALVAPGGARASSGSARVSIFYYPWYGTPARDEGGYRHWQQNGAAPPAAIASAFYPARGVYSSSDPRVVAAQMREITSAGVEQIATSWWGWGSLEDVHLPLVLRAARRAGLDVAVHLEPYPGRTPASIAADIGRLRAHGITDYYVYGADDGTPWDWAAVNDGLSGVRVFAQTGRVGFASKGRFDGIYTYDVLTYGGMRFARLCTQARRRSLLCVPSVGPGYDARRAMADGRVKPRRRGATYDSMWSAAIRARADLVTITSYNEWHEGSQIEPARARGRHAGYEGAWGLRGRAAERAYLDRTRLWSRRYLARFR